METHSSQERDETGTPANWRKIRAKPAAFVPKAAASGVIDAWWCRVV